MMVVNIRDLQNLFPSQKIVRFTSGPLTAPGENYLSIMLWLDIEFADQPLPYHGHYVSKLLPANACLRKLVNSDMLFRNEAAFYEHIIPVLEAIIKKESCFPKFVAARTSLDGRDTVDQDAVLILDNLKMKGYKMLDRRTSFDLPTSVVVVQTLARFHASSVALRLNDFERFQCLASKYLKFYRLADMPADYETELIRCYTDVCRPLIEPAKLEAILKRGVRGFYRGKNCTKILHSHIFNTIIHTDCWVNNFLIKYNTNGEPIDVKMVDFQLFEYGACARDLMLLLFTSVQQMVIHQSYKLLLEAYLEEFVCILREANCDPLRIQQYTMNDLENELKIAAQDLELLHCFMMLQPRYADEKFIEHVENIDENQQVEQITLTAQPKKRALFITKFFLEKGWL